MERFFLRLSNHYVFAGPRSNAVTGLETNSGLILYRNHTSTTYSDLIPWAATGTLSWRFNHINKRRCGN